MASGAKRSDHVTEWSRRGKGDGDREDAEARGDGDEMTLGWNTVSLFFFLSFFFFSAPPPSPPFTHLLFSQLKSGGLCKEPLHHFLTIFVTL
jgi:hypothetical protein